MNNYQRCNQSSDDAQGDVSFGHGSCFHEQSPPPPTYSSLNTSEGISLADTLGAYRDSHDDGESRRGGLGETDASEAFPGSSATTIVASSSDLTESSLRKSQPAKGKGKFRRLGSKPSWLASKSKSGEKQAKPPSEPVRTTQDSWLLEISSLLCSIVSFAGLLGLLIRFNDKPLSEWKVSGISINTPIAVFASISRASLALAVSACIAQFKWNWFSKYEEPLIDFDRLDAASRGPWGSVRLMRTMVRRPHWITLGALTTIILIGFEPLVQALIRFEDESFIKTANNTWAQQAQFENGNSKYSATVSEDATIGRCSYLDAGSYVESSTKNAATNIRYTGKNGENMTFPQYNFDLRVDFGMTAAIWNGLSDLVRAPNLSPSFLCTSGNCTWDEFTSLAVCSKCANITHHLVKKTGSTMAEGSGTDSGWSADAKMPEVSNQGVWANLGFLEQKHNFTKYTIPQSGLNLSNYDGVAHCSSSNDNCPDTYMSAKVISNPGLTISFRNLHTMILAMQVIQPSNSWQKNETVWEDTVVEAQECSLSFCVNAYQSKVEQGTLQEKVVSSWTSRPPNCYESQRIFNDTEFTEYKNYTLNNLNVPRTDLQIHIPQKNSSKFAGRKYNITESVIAGMLDVFSQGFDNVTMETDDSAYEDIPVLIYPSNGWNDPSRFMLGIGNAHDIIGTFDNLASSLSKWMRDRQLDDTPIKGHILQTMVVMRVNWAYLTLPVFALVTGVAFVILSIWETKRLKLPAWKTDALVPLVHGSDRELSEKLEAAAEENRLHDVATKVRVSMQDVDGLKRLGTSNGVDA